MTVKYLILLLGTFGLASCIYSKVQDGKVKSSNDLKTEKRREACIETNQEEFFRKMINQRLSKVEGNNWDILYKDTAYIYYGYALLTKKGLYADSIFKVRRS